MVGMKERVTLSLDATTTRYLADQAATETGGNISAWVDRHVRHLALTASVAAHAHWYADHPAAAEADEAERYASGAAA